MRIGIGLPQLGRFADIDTLRQVAIAAEAAELSSLWAIDRLLVPVNPRSAYPTSADGTLPPEQRTAIDPIVVTALNDRLRSVVGLSVLRHTVGSSPWLSVGVGVTLDRAANCFGWLSVMQWPTAISSGVMSRRSATTGA